MCYVVVCNKMSTYEYIVKQREKEEALARAKDTDLEIEEQTTTSASCFGVSISSQCSFGCKLRDVRESLRGFCIIITL